MISNYAGQDFDFLTPNIRFLGDMTAENGYQNLFVQGGGLDFSGTAKFLYEHGFKKENVYDWTHSRVRLRMNGESIGGA